MEERRTVTVVSGLPRSGTSLMMQMLGAGGMPVLSDGMRAADEDNPRGYLELEAVKRMRKDAAWLSEAQGKAVKVIHLLLRDLPPDRAYRVVFMRRPVAEVVASQRAMLKRSGRQGARLPDDNLAALLEAQARDTQAWMARQPHFRVLAVDYRDCIEQPGEVAARVNAFLGGRLDEAAMAGVVDAGLYRQRAGR
ncbi:MAG: sulfotransferase [Bryobacteraceae bacterium]|jgi:hypothetical protein